MPDVNETAKGFRRRHSRHGQDLTRQGSRIGEVSWCRLGQGGPVIFARRPIAPVYSASAKRNEEKPAYSGGTSASPMHGQDARGSPVSPCNLSPVARSYTRNSRWGNSRVCREYCRVIRLRRGIFGLTVRRDGKQRDLVGIPVCGLELKCTSDEHGTPANMAIRSEM